MYLMMAKDNIIMFFYVKKKLMTIIKIDDLCF